MTDTDSKKNGKSLRCKKCGSSKITRKARLVWNVEKQEWVIGRMFSALMCEHCEDFAEVEWF